MCDFLGKEIVGGWGLFVIMQENEVGGALLAEKALLSVIDHVIDPAGIEPLWAAQAVDRKEKGKLNEGNFALRCNRENRVVNK